MLILTLNCGSSSAKFQIYDWDIKEVLLVGSVERIGEDNASLKLSSSDGRTILDETFCENHDIALEWVIQHITRSGCIANLSEIQAVGHRIVHGGEHFTKSTIIDKEILRAFGRLTDLAPLHMPANISGIKAAQNALPHATHCAVIDTAWHQTMPAEAYMYPVPYDWYTESKVRRYGFHGTSYIYTAKRAACLLGKKAIESNLIIAHIGNGASMCAVKNGVCIDTSMGLTPLEGLMMGSRSGSVDPAILTYMMDHSSYSARAIDAILNKESGIFGITGGDIDRRDVYRKLEAGDKRAKLAYDMECYRVRKQIGAYAAILGRIDALVFTAGVGEMSPEYRRGMTSGLELLGIELDEEKNKLSQSPNCETKISKHSSFVDIFVIPTDEELVMTADAVALMEGRYDVHTKFSYDFAKQEYKNPARERNLLKDLEKNPRLKEIVAIPPEQDS